MSAPKPPAIDLRALLEHQHHVADRSAPKQPFEVQAADFGIREPSIALLYFPRALRSQVVECRIQIGFRPRLEQMRKILLRNQPQAGRLREVLPRVGGW